MVMKSLTLMISLNVMIKIIEFELEVQLDVLGKVRISRSFLPKLTR